MKPSDLPPEFSLQLLDAEISGEANRCVACGLCLPHCPTYRITLSEADSPRGRIALISGVAAGRVPMNERFALHMDRCLTCRACEAACPNHVRFGQLIDGSRAAMTASQLLPLDGKAAMRKSWARRWVERELLTRPARIDALRPLLRFYQRGGLQKWARKSGLLGKATLALLEAQLPPIGKPFAASVGADFGSWQVVYPSVGKSRGRVGLFLGCVARLADIATLNAAIFVLNRLGYTVHVPPAQTCCGALHQHGGDLEMAAQLSGRNIVAFNGLKLDAIISTASGCGVQLAEHVFLPSSSQPSATPYQLHSESKGSVAEGNPGNGLAGKFTAGVMDISAFLAVAEGWDEVKLAPLPHEIMVHEPCTLRNVLRASAHSYALMTRIPEARVAPLMGNDQCCGAAGTYFLDQPEMAKALRADKIEALLSVSGARYLATSNVGCAMYIGSGLREAGLEIEIVHPVTLVARQMGIQ